ncbi:MAG: M48 family metalloprotease [Balneolaceae bacterium]
MKKRIAHLIGFLSILLFASSCAVQKNPVTGQTRLLAYTWSQEVEIGREVDQELVAQFGLFDDDAVSAYVESVSEDILSHSHMRRPDTDEQFRNTEFFFRVLDSPVVNAFALPGGYVYVTRGLMAHLNNEAQFAVVIGHEIGHVAARHASQRALQQQLGQIAVIGGAVLGQEVLGLPGESIAQLSSQAAQLIFLSYGRNAERESDALGVEYSAMAGYAAEEGSEFFTSLKRISERSGQSIPTRLSTHPDPGEREQNIPRMAQEWREQGYEANVYNADRYLDILDGMIFGENPRDGFVEGNRYLHPNLEFQFAIPSGWQLINQPSQVVLISPDEDAINILQIDTQATSPEQSVRGFIAQDGITENSSEATRVGGEFPAFVADITIAQDGGNLRAVVYAIGYNDRVYRFINYTSESRFADFEAIFLQTPETFDRVTDPAILNVNPVVLRVIEAPRTDTFRNLLPDELPMGIQHDEVAILNQVFLDETIQQGTRIKIPTQ